MKITVYILIAVFLASSVTAFAETRKESPKKDIIEAQQAETQEAIEAAKNARPQVETRPAAIYEHTKHAEILPKAEMIKAQEAATNKAIEDTKAAKPGIEARPATRAFGLPILMGRVAV